MNQKLKLLIIIIALAAVLCGAYFAYRHFSEDYKNTTTAPAQNGTADAGNADAAPADETREAAPDFTVYDKEGNSVSLLSKAGKPVVVNFWATWCPPCRSELPAYEALYKTYGDRVEFMMVALTDGESETQSSVDSFIAENGYSFPVYYDLHGSAAEAYSVMSIPVSLFIDKNGNIAHTQIGAMDEGTLEAYIKTVLE